jgi:hypothetical protein
MRSQIRTDIACSIDPQAFQPKSILDQRSIFLLSSHWAQGYLIVEIGTEPRPGTPRREGDGSAVPRPGSRSLTVAARVPQRQSNTPGVGQGMRSRRGSSNRSRLFYHAAHPFSSHCGSKGVRHGYHDYAMCLGARASPILRANFLPPRCSPDCRSADRRSACRMPHGAGGALAPRHADRRSALRQSPAEWVAGNSRSVSGTPALPGAQKDAAHPGSNAP